MKSKCTIFGLLLLLMGCDSASTESIIQSDSASTDSIIESHRSDGAVNGYILTSERGYRDFGENRSNWIITAKQPDQSYGGFEVCSNNVCGGSSYDFDERGRVRRFSHAGSLGVSITEYELQEDLVTREYGTHYDFVFMHDEKGNVASMNKSAPGISADFTYNDAGQITYASFINIDGRAKYYTHLYNDKGQRIRTEESSNFNDLFEGAYEYHYDENGNNILQVAYLPTGDIVGEIVFEYQPSDHRIVNLRLRDLIYFDFFNSSIWY